MLLTLSQCHTHRIDLKPFKQSDDSRCGEASVRMVLSHYGVRTNEDSICVLTNHTYELGSDDAGIKRALEFYGLCVEVRNNSSLEDVEHAVALGIPVIVDYFAAFGYDNYGHSSVVVDIDESDIYLMDPYYGRIRKMKRPDFERVWFDWRDSELISCDNLIQRQMILSLKKY